MARADILISMVKSALANDSVSFRKSVEALAAEERFKNHRILADRLNDLLNSQTAQQTKQTPFVQNGAKDLLFEITAEKRLSDLIISEENLSLCQEFIEEQHRADLLRSYGVSPRNRLLFVGPPGNGKTSLAEAMAYELLAPLLVIRYDNLIGSYLGETASRLQKVFDVARSRRCVLFLDEFETLGKERGDTRETGEIKRVVSSLLLQIDRLPEHTVVITASNHPELLDTAVWRRFQIKIELKLPTKQQIISFLELFENKTSFCLRKSHGELADKLRGSNFAEIEDFCTDILRQAILQHKHDDPREIVTKRLKSWISRYIQKT
jgi:AAA+ superfamily predicted ATPase